ncbi:MAG: protease [Planctomycetota bacterium]|nr:MAG: protease [Planctomycetota bacterium]
MLTPPLRRLGVCAAVLALAAGLPPVASAAEVLAALERAFRQAAARAAPAVVGIEVERDAVPAARREVAEFLLPPGTPASGVVVAPEGLVLTSARNVAGAREVRVVLPAGGRLLGEVLATDAELDLALVRALDAPADLPAVAFRPAVPPPVGSWLVVVGFGPEGRPSVNTGIVSAIGRFDGLMLQTDAAINHTNRGGLAVDIEGRPLGVVVHRSDRVGVNSGVGFVAAAGRIAERLPALSRGESIAPRPRPFLGIRLGEERLDPSGIVVAGVLPGSAAAAAELLAGDLIHRIGEVTITDARSLSRALRRYAPGDRVVVVVVRDGVPRELELVLGARPEADE